MRVNCRPVLLIVASLACGAGGVGCTSEADMTNPGDDLAAKPADVPANRAPTRPRKPSGLLPVFETIAAESGLDFQRYDDIRGLRRIIESTGGGGAVFDFDRDGWLDIFLTNGCRLPLSRGERSHRGELFRNDRGRRFRSVTDPSRLVEFGYNHGCAVGDVDGDGFDDLYITSLGRNALWHNNGDGTFTEITEQTGTAVPAWSSSAAFADLDGDGHLDLYVANYLEVSDESPQLCPNPASPDGYEQCPPAMFEGVDDVLFLSDGAGGFVDATEHADLNGSRGKGLGVAISDLTGDGRPEIYVANDGQANFLWVPVTGGEGGSPPEGSDPSRSGIGIEGFEDQALVRGAALSEDGHAQASMGIAVGDYNADSRMDLFLTHFSGDTNTLYANRGAQFEDVTRGSGLGTTSLTTLGWGTVFLDVDNNGWLDLFVANGHVEDRTWLNRGEPYRMRPQMYRSQRDGTFADVSDWSGDYFRKSWLGRGVAAGDLDRDERIDLVVSHQLEPSVGLRNQTPTENNALVLRLVGTSSNRNGYGARVEVLDAEPTIVRELTGGGSYQSASAPEVHLGLGTHRRATVRIEWPSGTRETYRNLEAGTWVATEGEGLLRLAVGE